MIADPHKSKNQTREDTFFMGIDIQRSRACPYAIMDSRDQMVQSGWLVGDTDEQRCGSLLEVVRDFEDAHHGLFAFGIDCPRCLRPTRRNFYVDRSRRAWRPRRESESGVGRHCDVVVKSANIANPQWTPVVGQVASDKQWMLTGVAMFEALADWKHVYEVFPSASYRLFGEIAPRSIRLDLSQLHPGPKDMLDACVAAVTVRRFVDNQGCEVGGADNLGTIVLPVDITARLPEFLQTIPSNLL